MSMSVLDKCILFLPFKVLLLLLSLVLCPLEIQFGVPQGSVCGPFAFSTCKHAFCNINYKPTVRLNDERKKNLCIIYKAQSHPI